MRDIVTATGAAFMPVLAAAQIYAGSSPQTGGVVLSNFATPEVATVIVAAPSGSALANGTAPLVVPSAVLGADSFVRTLQSASKRSAVPVELLHAVISAESNYKTDAVSKKGAMGLMQLMPDTAKRFGVKDAFDPAQNVAGGASYLGWLMQLFDRDVELVVAAYNAGEQAVLRAGRKVPPYPETQAYVRRVMASLGASSSGLLVGVHGAADRESVEERKPPGAGCVITASERICF